MNITKQLNKDFKVKAIKLAKEIVRDRNDYCERCLSPKKSDSFPGGKKVDGAHIIPEGSGITDCMLDNIMCLCVHCHKFGKLSWHESPVHGVKWLENNKPGLIARLIKESSRLVEKFDWKEEYEKLISLK